MDRRCIWGPWSQTPGVWKSTCSMAAFIQSTPPRDGSFCPYCGWEVEVHTKVIESSAHSATESGLGK